MPEEDALLEEIISKINERFDGIFSEGDRVIVETLYNRAKENKKLNRQAQKNDEEVYTKSIFPEVFKQVAQDCYIEQMKAFSKLFEDKRFYDTVMATLAQEESRSISENVTWGQRKRFADGKVNLPYKQFLGYRKGADGFPEVVPEEAIVVHRIYTRFMEGLTPGAIAKELTADGIPTPSRKQRWQTSTVESILQNEKYKGAALLQKCFTVDFLTKKEEGQ